MMYKGLLQRLASEINFLNDDNSQSANESNGKVHS